MYLPYEYPKLICKTGNRKKVLEQKVPVKKYQGKKYPENVPDF